MTDHRSLRLRLEDYDGTHTRALESLASELQRTAAGVPEAVWEEVIQLSLDEEARIAAGATWLLRRWAEAGHRPTESAIRTLSQGLRGVTGIWARLHLVQAVPSLPLSGSLIPTWADFCGEGAGSEAPFLRAWSVNALVHLARLDPDIQAEANAALEAALTDPKASVRARARRILEGK